MYSVFKSYGVNVLKEGSDTFVRFVTVKSFDQAKIIFDACVNSEAESNDWVKVEIIQIDISIVGETEYTSVIIKDTNRSGFVL